MRLIEKILITISAIAFILKELSVPFAGIILSSALFLLAIFYLTSKAHIFRDKEFKVFPTLISGLVMFISIVFLNLSINNWSNQLKPLQTILVIQVVWLVYLFIKVNNNKELHLRMSILSIVFLLTVVGCYLENLL